MTEEELKSIQNEIKMVDEQTYREELNSKFIYLCRDLDLFVKENFGRNYSIVIDEDGFVKLFHSKSKYNLYKL